jgi:hypothetical protein
VNGAQCNSCRFWKLDETTKDELNADWGFGFCRRKPPTLVDSLVAAEIVPPRYGHQSDLDRPDPTAASIASVWPATFATEWCGEHSRVPDGGAQ